MITCPVKSDWSLLQKLSYETNKRIRRHACVARQLKEDQERIQEQVLGRLRAHRKESMEFVRKNITATSNHQSNKKPKSPLCHSRNCPPKFCKTMFSGHENQRDAINQSINANPPTRFEEALQIVSQCAKYTILGQEVMPKNLVHKQPSTSRCIMPSDRRCSPNYEDRSSASVVAVSDSPHSVDLEDTQHDLEELQEGTEYDASTANRHKPSATRTTDQNARERKTMVSNGSSNQLSLRWLRTGTPPLDGQTLACGKTLEMTNHESTSQVRASKQTPTGLIYATCTVPIVMAAPVYTINGVHEIVRDTRENVRNAPVLPANTQSKECARPVLCNPFFVSHRGNNLTSDRVKHIGHTKIQENNRLTSLKTSECLTEPQESGGSNLSPVVVRQCKNVDESKPLYSCTDNSDAENENKDSTECVFKPSPNDAGADDTPTRPRNHTPEMTSGSFSSSLYIDAHYTRDSLEVTPIRFSDGAVFDIRSDHNSLGTMRSPGKLVRFSDPEEEKTNLTKPCSQVIRSNSNFFHQRVRNFSGPSARLDRASGPVISVIYPQSGSNTSEPSNANTLVPVDHERSTLTDTCDHHAASSQELVECQKHSDTEPIRTFCDTNNTKFHKLTSRPLVAKASFRHRRRSVKSSPPKRSGYANLFIGRPKAQPHLTSLRSPAMNDAPSSTRVTPQYCEHETPETPPIIMRQPILPDVNSITSSDQTEPTRNINGNRAIAKVFTTAKLDELAARVFQSHHAANAVEEATTISFRLPETSSKRSEPEVGHDTTMMHNVKNASRGDQRDFSTRDVRLLENHTLQNPVYYAQCSNYGDIHSDDFMTNSNENTNAHQRCGRFGEFDENSAPWSSFAISSQKSSSRSTFILSPSVSEDNRCKMMQTNQMNCQEKLHPQGNLPNIHAGLRVGVWRLLRQRPRISEPSCLKKNEPKDETKQVETVLRGSLKAAEVHSSTHNPEYNDVAVQVGETLFTSPRLSTSGQCTSTTLPNLPKPIMNKGILSNSSATKQAGDHNTNPTSRQGTNGTVSLRDAANIDLLDSLTDFIETESVHCQTDRSRWKQIRPAHSKGNPAHSTQSTLLFSNGFGVPSAISMEEARLLQSLEKLNTRLCVVLSDRR